MAPTSKERREKHPKPEPELYKADIDKFIEKERRADELDRLREVKEQKKIWLYTVLFCGALVFLFAALSVLDILNRQGG